MQHDVKPEPSVTEAVTRTVQANPPSGNGYAPNYERGGFLGVPDYSRYITGTPYYGFVSDTLRKGTDWIHQYPVGQIRIRREYAHSRPVPFVAPNVHNNSAEVSDGDYKAEPSQVRNGASVFDIRRG